MLYYIYLYISNKFLLTIDSELNFIFILFIILFFVLNIILTLLHKFYNNDSTLKKILKDKYIDIYELNILKTNPIESACLKDSRLPNKRDVISLILYLINKKYIILNKDQKNNYYLEKTKKEKKSLSTCELLLLDKIPNKKCNLKTFIFQILKKNNCKEILNTMTLEITNKFKISKRPIIFDLFFLILKYILIGFFFVLITNIFININFEILTTIQKKIVTLDFIFILFETIILAYIFYIFNHKTYNYLSIDKNVNKFLLINLTLLVCFLLLFLLTKPIAVLLLFIYTYSLLLVLIDKRIFVKELNNDFNLTIETISLYNYLNNYSLLKEKEIAQIKIYDVLFTYAFAFNINLKTDNYLNTYKIFGNRLLMENKINFDYFINSNLDFPIKRKNIT